VLRTVLVVRGGQEFWPDEVRFDAARAEANDIIAGHLYSAAKIAFGSADHLFFRIWGIFPALFERVLHSGPWLPGMFFAAVSTAVLWATGRVSRASGGGEREQFFTVFAAAASTSLLYYSRHFLPYDLSLVFFLMALSLALRSTRTAWQSFRVGLWAAFGFLSYNGYWNLVPVIAGLYAVTAASPRSFLSSVVGFSVGFLIPNIVTFAAARGVGVDLGASYATFSKTIVQGDFEQAWRFVGEYFWQAEGVNALIFLGAIGVILWAAFKGPPALGGVYAALIVMVIYALIVLGSDICFKFTVCARHVRVIAPFGAWAIGAALAWSFERGRWGRASAVICCFVMVITAARNFWVPLTQMFPLDFDAAARAYIESDRAAGDGLQPLRIINDTFLHNPDWNIPTPAAERVLWSRPHPYDFLPYLFEGYREDARRAYQQRERSMKILRFDGVTPIRSNPYAFKLSFSPGAQSAQNLAEPILCSGSTGAGDLVFIQYLDGGKATVGFDHWGSAARVSAPFPFERGRQHSIIVIAPSLIGSVGQGNAGHRNFDRWRHRVYVAIDGVCVLNVETESFSTDVKDVTVGLNLIGASTSQTSLELNAARFSALDDADWARAESGN
jgi:hypothetical protein